MKKRNNGTGSTKRGAKAINESLNKRLAVYALAAGAAGVGVLALSPAAQAGIIMGTGTPITIGVNTTEFLKINGKNVLSFADSNAFVVISTFGRLVANGVNGAGFMSAPLAKSAAVGPAGAFVGRRSLVLNTHDSLVGSVLSGPWANKSGYLGFKFESNGKSYFGWAHLKVTANGKNGETGLISSFAYDNVAGQSILTGEKPTVTPESGTLTLFLLALGAVGLVELRRRRVAPAAAGS